MTIGMLLNAPYPSDLRIKKETDALLKAGFKIFLLCLRRANEKEEETIQGVNIYRIDAGKNDIHLAFWDAIMSVSFVHPVFKSAIPGWVKKNDIRILHIHDLPLVGTALSLRKRLNIPVVADFHENYPDALRTWFAWRKNPLVKLKNKIFMNPDRWATLEKKATQEADHVIAVVQEMKQRLIRDYQVSDAKITIVSNTEELSFLNQPEDPAVYEPYKGKFIVTYSGNIGPHRGVDTVIEAMQYLKNYPQIVFLIIGSGSNAVMSLLKNSVEKLGLNGQVFFMGRQPFEKFYSFMLFADVNVIPHKSNGHTDNTIPHKLFQAMMVGKPVLVSSSTPLKRVIETTNAGVVFKAGDPEDLSKKILSLYENKALQKELGENGKRTTVKGTLNWEHEQQSLIALYKKMLS
jgi:glycosyltransferase involved in cell wall biosynthesis